MISHAASVPSCAYRRHDAIAIITADGCAMPKILVAVAAERKVLLSVAKASNDFGLGDPSAGVAAGLRVIESNDGADDDA